MDFLRAKPNECGHPRGDATSEADQNGSWIGEEAMTTRANDSEAKKYDAAEYLRRWRRGQIPKRNSVTRITPYSVGYHRGYRAGCKRGTKNE
jgi:hypothetical protein